MSRTIRGPRGPPGTPRPARPPRPSGCVCHRVAAAGQPEVQTERGADQVQRVVRLVDVQDVEVRAAVDEQPKDPDHQVDGADQDADGAGAGLAAGGGQPEGPDAEVDDVVQRVDPEQQELVVRGPGEVGEPCEGEPEQADEHVDGPEHLGETLDGHDLATSLGGWWSRWCRLAGCSWGRLDRFIRPPNLARRWYPRVVPIAVRRFAQWPMRTWYPSSSSRPAVASGPSTSSPGCSRTGSSSWARRSTTPSPTWSWPSCSIWSRRTPTRTSRSTSTLPAGRSPTCWPSTTPCSTSSRTCPPSAWAWPPRPPRSSWPRGPRASATPCPTRPS